MKKIILVLVLMLFAIPAFGANVDTYVTASNVSFTTAGKVVTYSTAVNRLMITNDYDSNGDVYITLRQSELGWNSDLTFYTTPVFSGGDASGSTVVIPTGNTVVLDISVNRIGYCGSGNGRANIVAFSDRGQP